MELVLFSLAGAIVRFISPSKFQFLFAKSCSTIKPKILSKDRVCGYAIGACVLCPIDPDRHPSCRLSVCRLNVRCAPGAEYTIRENLKHEKEITLPIQTHSDIFGVPLEDIMGYDGEKGGIPRVVKDCIQYLRESGIVIVLESTTAPHQLFV